MCFALLQHIVYQLGQSVVVVAFTFLMGATFALSLETQLYHCPSVGAVTSSLVKLQ